MGKHTKTKADREHLGRVAALGCIACRNSNRGFSPAEIHHIRAGYGMSQRAPDTEAIPLCPRHHRTGNHGEAIHQGQRTWEAKFGTETELLEQVRMMLRDE